MKSNFAHTLRLFRLVWTLSRYGALFPLDAFHAFSLDFYGGRLLLRRLLEGALLSGRQATGPLVRRRLAHQICPARFDKCNFVLSPFLEEIKSSMGKLGALHAPPERLFLPRLQFFDRDAAMQTCF